jgi:hypothetical protein
VPFAPGGVWCIQITPVAQKVVTDAFNGFLIPPVAQKSAINTDGGLGGEFGARNSPRARASRPQPPAGGTDGIQPAAGSPTSPVGCRPAHARAGGGGAGFGVPGYRSPVLNFPAAPCHGRAAPKPSARENGIRTSQSRGARTYKTQRTSSHSKSFWQFHGGSSSLLSCC